MVDPRVVSVDGLPFLDGLRSVSPNGIGGLFCRPYDMGGATAGKLAATYAPGTDGTAATETQALMASLPIGWVWAAAVVAIVAIVVTGWLFSKWLDHRFTAGVVNGHGTGCLPQLTEHNRSSSMAVVADVLRAAADLIRATGEVFKAIFSRGSSGDGSGSGAPPTAP